MALAMLWVTDHWQNSKPNQYNSARSAFWRVIRGVTSQLDIADVENASWPSHLVWSNLYKVSPHSACNPNGRLGEIQLRGCLELPRMELSIYRPRRLLFLTGHDWAEPFLKHIDFQPTSSRRRSLAEASGTIPSHTSGETTNVAVAKHPQGKPEGAWVQEVIAAFG